MAKKNEQNPLGLKHPALVPLPEALRPLAVSEQSREGSEGMGQIRAKSKRSAYVAKAKPFVRVSGEARKQAALPTLLAALELVRTRGWCQGAMVDATGRVSLNGAVLVASEGRLEGEFARELLRDAAWTANLPEWNDNPARRRADVVRVLRRAIGMAGGHLARGGWFVAGVAR